MADTARKQAIDDRQEILLDRINLANAELDGLNHEYEDILQAEEDECNKLASEEAMLAAEAMLEEDPDLVKLVNVDRNTWISLTKDPSTLIYFDHPDGMYSYCVSPLGQLTHIALGSMVYTYPGLDLDAPVFPPATPGQFRTT